MRPAPLSELITRANLRPCRVAFNAEITMSPLGFVAGDDFIADTVRNFCREEGAESRAHLIARLLNAAPLIDQLVTACENLETDADNSKLHEAITLAPELRAILDGE